MTIYPYSPYYKGENKCVCSLHFTPYQHTSFYNELIANIIIALNTRCRKYGEFINLRISGRFKLLTKKCYEQLKAFNVFLLQLSECNVN